MNGIRFSELIEIAYLKDNDFFPLVQENKNYKTKLITLKEYFQNTEYIDEKLNTKADINHAHLISDILNMPSNLSDFFNDLDMSMYINKNGIELQQIHEQINSLEHSINLVNHNNIDVLNKLSDDGNGKLKYNGQILTDNFHAHSNIDVLNVLTIQKINFWDSKSEFDGDYNSLINKPVIPIVDVTKLYVDTELSKKSPIVHEHDVSNIVNFPVIPSKTSELTNDSHLATESYVISKIAEAQLDGEVDISVFVTHEELDVVQSDIVEYISSNYATNEYVDSEILNIELTPGPQGPKGDTGLIGPQGLKGDPGSFNPNEEFEELVTENKTIIGAINETLSAAIQLNEFAIDVLKDTDEVEIIEPTSINISNNISSVMTGGSYQVDVAFSPSNTTDKTVKYSSGNESVATINSYGKVTTNRNGTTLIRVYTETGLSSSLSLTVSDSFIHASSVSLNLMTSTIAVGESKTLVATVLPENAMNKNIIWSTSSSIVATVDNKGVVSAKKTGTVTITATTEDGNYFAPCGITVI